MPEPFDPAFVTLFAELAERVSDAGLIEGLPPGGTFELRTTNGRDYWYHRAYNRATGKDRVRYVGPATAALTARIERHRSLQPDIRGRRQLVSTLRRAGFPAPDTFTGEIIAALARAGVFRLRACLVGTVAYQCYPAMLGVHLPAAAMRTEDVDIAQFHAIAVGVEDAAEPLLDTLQEVDPTFTPVPSLKSPMLSSTLRNARGYRVELLTPHQGSDERGDDLLPLPSIPGLGAQPLRFLDYLLYGEVPTVVLHGPGIAVNVPAPERYAVHKLIVASRRSGAGRLKAAKDAAQAGSLIQALVATRQADMLRDAWDDAMARGPHWRKALQQGVRRLEAEAAAQLEAVTGPIRE
ncbi:MAG: GSU2403 family nucleotidyltransferase fold protein [Geminicoccaceae bacterium]